MDTKTYGLPSYLKGKSFSEAAAELNDRFSERQDPISQKTYKTMMGRLQNYQEDLRAEKAEAEFNAKAAELGIPPEQLKAQMMQMQQQQMQQQAPQQGQSIPQQGQPQEFGWGGGFGTIFNTPTSLNLGDNMSLDGLSLNGQANPMSALQSGALAASANPLDGSTQTPYMDVLDYSKSPNIVNPASLHGSPGVGLNSVYNNTDLGIGMNANAFNKGNGMSGLEDGAFRAAASPLDGSTQTPYSDAYANGELPTSFDFSGNASGTDWGSILGNGLRAAPIAANIANLAMMRKPDKVARPMMTERYTPETLSSDRIERSLANQAASSRNALLESSNGNFGEYGNQVGAVQSNYNEGLSNALFGIENSNAGINNKASQYNIAQANKNVNREGQYNIMDEQNMAAYNSGIAGSIAGLGENLGGVGTELNNRAQVDKLYGDEGAMKQLYMLMAMMDKKGKK